MNMDNPFAILAAAIFVLFGAASVLGPAHWNTERPKVKFALMGGLLIIAGVSTFLFLRS